MHKGPGFILLLMPFMVSGLMNAADSAHPVKRTDLAIEIDGRIDEEAWAQASPLELNYETNPGENTPPPVATRCWFLHSDSHFYVGCQADDPEPEKIRARFSDRDRAFNDDFVGVVIDTFNDERRAYEFFVNPLGVQMDLIQDDVNGNEDSSWDAIWDSAGLITDTGYQVEMAIPFSSLRFQRGEGIQDWGLDIVRIWPRDRRFRLGLNALERDVSCYLCQATKIRGFEGAEPGKNLEINPTFTTGRTESIDPGDPAGGLGSASSEYDPGWMFAGASRPT